MPQCAVVDDDIAVAVEVGAGGGWVRVAAGAGRNLAIRTKF